jgi:oxygen-independent coproporphyrinogen-3 oxidase
MSQAAQTGARVVATFTSPGQVRLVAAAARAVRAFSVVRAQVPVLRFQFARMERRALPEAEYLDALRADLEQALPLVWGRQVHTVFIGGGTSLLSAAGLDRLLSDARCCRSTRMPRSRWRPTPARSKRRSSRSFARAA